MKLEILNTDGCGVCQNSTWDKEYIDTKIKYSFLQKAILKIKLWLKLEIKTNQPYCIKFKKLVKPLYKCLEYKPKKQIKIFGSLKDEDITFDNKMLRN
jgi:hypothetical protein